MPAVLDSTYIGRGGEWGVVVKESITNFNLVTFSGMLFRNSNLKYYFESSSHL